MLLHGLATDLWEKLLTVANENEPADGKLVASLMPRFALRRSFGATMPWLAPSKVVSRKNVVALFRVCLSFPLANAADYLKLGHELMARCARNKAGERYRRGIIGVALLQFGPRQRVPEL